MNNIQQINPNFWNEYSRLYDKFIPQFQKELLKDLSQYAKGYICDFGCGTGKLHRYLAQNRNISKIDAIDTSEQMLNLAIKNKPLNLNIKYFNSFQDKNKYDSIYMVNMLYANSNPIEIIKKISQNLSTNGRLIIADMKRENNLETLYLEMIKEYRSDHELDKYFKLNQILSQTSSPSPYRINELESIIQMFGDFKIIEKNEKHFLENMNCLVVEQK
jgi:2-polyprenyl-3-methyl-5-hydroxy-6-metoxy-1,4-benzoquinol methylase